MECSGSGLDLIKSFESCRLEAYQDIRGIWTQGYGRTFGISASSPPITQEQADTWLAEDVQFAVDSVNRLIKVPLTQGQMDACCSFTFNLGSGNFAGSTLLKLINQGDFSGASNQFPLWDHAGSTVIPGLLRRRLAEQAEFGAV
jgi:lysozyme